MFKVFHHAEQVATATNGVAAVFPIPVPPSGILGTLNVKQTSGDLDGFTIKIFCSEDAARDTLPTLSGGSGPDGYLIIQETVAVAGGLYQGFGLDAVYQTCDQDQSGVMASTYIWLVITPAGAGAEAKNFDVGYFVEASG
jgi:hypothetical protein